MSLKILTRVDGDHMECPNCGAEGIFTDAYTRPDNNYAKDKVNIIWNHPTMTTNWECTKCFLP